MLYLSFQDEDFDKVRRKEIDKSKKLSPADNNHLAPPAGHRVSHDSTSLQQQQHHLIHKSCRNYRVVKAWRSEQVETLQWQSRSERVTSHWLQRHRRAACLPFRATLAAFLGEWPPAQHPLPHARCYIRSSFCTGVWFFYFVLLLFKCAFSLETENAVLVHTYTWK